MHVLQLLLYIEFAVGKVQILLLWFFLSWTPEVIGPLINSNCMDSSNQLPS